MANKISTAYYPIFGIAGFKQEELTGIYCTEIISTVRTPEIHFIRITSAKKSKPVTIRYADIQFHCGGSTVSKICSG
jgi:hypothetical protein